MKNYVRAKRLSVCGAPVFLHWSVLVVMGGCLAMAVSDPITAIVAAVSYFSVILIHEWGHAFVASRLGYAIDSIRLSVIHGECVYDASYETAREAALIAWGGPLAQFAAAVLVAEPTAIGGPVSILKSGDTVVRAFIHAGIYALLVIGLLLWITLRRFVDVLMTLVPLLVAGAVTLEICVLIGLPLNFANIVAFPLLLGVGVAFKIYYVVAWRSGRTNLLQTSLTRAIFFSALTTATAFGSLWLSSHPGTSSMGKLLALSLVTTLAAVLLFQPALMGKPRNLRE